MTNQQPSPESKTVTPPEKHKKRRGGRFLNLLLLLGIIGAIALFAWAEQQRREAINRLKQTEQELEEIRKATQRSGADVAQQVLEKVRKHMDLPTDPQPTVATIIDIDRLRQSNEFYNRAENGDHLIITTNRAILYDPDRDLVVDVVPVRVDVQQQATPEAQAPTQEPPPPPAQQTPGS